MPVAVTESGVLLAGAARLELARELGWTHIDARVWESVDAPCLQLQLEWERNLGRADLPILTQARYVREVLRPVFVARVAMVQRGNANRLNRMLGNEVANFATSLPPAVGKWRDYISARVSFGGETMMKFLHMQDWSVDTRLSDLDRRRIGQEITAANESGKVDAPFRRAKRIFQAATVSSLPGGREKLSRAVLQVTRTEMLLSTVDVDAFAAAVATDADAVGDWEAAVQSAYRFLDQVDRISEAIVAVSRSSVSA